MRIPSASIPLARRRFVGMLPLTAFPLLAKPPAKKKAAAQPPVKSLPKSKASKKPPAKKPLTNFEYMQQALNQGKTSVRIRRNETPSLYARNLKHVSFIQRKNPFQKYDVKQIENALIRLVGSKFQAGTRLDLSLLEQKLNPKAAPSEFPTPQPLVVAKRKPENRPLLNSAQERYQSLMNDTPAYFPIDDNPTVIHVGLAKKQTMDAWFDYLKRYRDPEINRQAVEVIEKHKTLIAQFAQQYGLDARLLKTVMYLENGPWRHDGVPGLLDWTAQQLGVDWGRSHLPMNIKTDWLKMKGIPDNLNIIQNPADNIQLASILMKRIQDRIQAPVTAGKIAAIYNAVSCQKASPYSTLANLVYAEQPWEQEEPETAPDEPVAKSSRRPFISFLG